MTALIQDLHNLRNVGAEPPDSEKSYVITTEDIQQIRGFQCAALSYWDALELAGGRVTPTVANAARKVSWQVTPDDWRAAGYDVPPSVEPCINPLLSAYLGSLLVTEPQDAPTY